MRIRVIDLESTGLERTDHVVEIAAWDLEPETGMVAHVGSELVKPLMMPIPAIASAVHHITDEDVANAQCWELVYPKFIDDEVDAYAAHCAKFEQQWLGDKTGKPWICSMKCAYGRWPDAPAHSNQVLRYWLDLPLLEKRLCREPHRASSDAYITAHILGALFKTATVPMAQSLAGMVEISKRPSVLPNVLFGKHAGKKWPELPNDYLEWIISKEGSGDMDEDRVHTARVTLHRKRLAAQHAAGQKEMGV